MDKVTLKNKVLQQEKRIKELEEMVAALMEAFIWIRNWSRLK